MSRNARRRKGGPVEESAAKRVKPVDLAAEHIDSDDDDSENDHAADASSSDEEEEDLATKKVRLAKQYLQRLEKEEEESESDASDDAEEEEEEDDRIGRRLQRQRLKREGTFQQNVASKLNSAGVTLCATPSMVCTSLCS